MKALNTLFHMIAVLVGVAAVVVGLRWAFQSGVSPEQARTIDSLRVENATLDSTANVRLVEVAMANARVDSVQRSMRIRAKRDSAKHALAVDSLEDLIPDTATTVPRSIYTAVVASKDSSIALFHALYHAADDSLTAQRLRTDSLAMLLVNFQKQNAALIAQVNSLEQKANPGIFRRLKYAAPFLAGLYASCKVKALSC